MTDMNLEKLTMVLGDKKPSPTPALTQYAIDSIQSGRSNYPMNNLMVFLDGCGSGIVLYDIMEERYEAHNVEDIHTIISKLLEKYKVKVSVMNSKTNCFYTPASKDSKSISVMTFLSIVNYFNCRLEVL